MQMKNSLRPVSGVVLAIEIVPSVCNNAGHVGSLQRNRRGKLVPALAVRRTLDDVDFDALGLLIVGTDGPMESAAVVKAAIDVLEEVRRCDGCSRSVDLNLDRAQFGLDHYANGRGCALREREENHEHRRQRSHQGR